MAEALRAASRGQKQEAAAFSRSAARLVAQRGEAECDVTCQDAVDAAVARSFGCLFEVRTTYFHPSETTKARQKAAEAWASLLPYLLSTFLADTSQQTKERKSICITLARIVGTLRRCGDTNSAEVIHEWKFAIFAQGNGKYLPEFPATADGPSWWTRTSECDRLYPDLIPNPTDALAPLWVRGIEEFPSTVHVPPLENPLLK